jgi:excisionase family DNA binding protein
MDHIGFPLSEAAKYLGPHPKTLQRMDRRGVLPAHRTSTGRRYWDRAALDKYLGLTTAVQVKKRYAYCRVSSSTQTESPRFEGKITSGRVKEHSGCWFITIALDVMDQPKANSNAAIGIDFGLKTFATLSDGGKCDTQAYYR